MRSKKNTKKESKNLPIKTSIQGINWDSFSTEKKTTSPGEKSLQKRSSKHSKKRSHNLRLGTKFFSHLTRNQFTTDKRINHRAH